MARPGPEPSAATAGPRAPSPVAWASVLGFALLVAFSVVHLQPDIGRLWSGRTAPLTGVLLGEAFPPSLGDLTMVEWGKSAADTLAMSILALFMATAGGALLSFAAARNVLGPDGMGGEGGRSPQARMLSVLVYGASRTLLLFLRGVPAPIWALLFLFVFFPGILPGALALGAYTMGVLGRLMPAPDRRCAE